MLKIRGRYSLAIVLLCAVSSPACAGDAQIEAAKLCTQYIPFYERQYGVPSHLLSAISSTESGRWHNALNIALPYPWAINAEGKAYYFNSKSEAVAGVKKLQAQGVKSIDIGCMQVNLIHHPNAFGSLEQAFEPKNNIAYAASFLRNLYESEGNWRKATASYHSRTPTLGSQYVSRVFRSWETIISRLRLSRDTTVQQADAGFDGQDMIPDTPKSAVVKNNSLKATSTVASVNSKAPAVKPVKMKVINVSDNSKRNSGVMIFKSQPETADASVIDVQKPITIARADTTKTMPPNAKIVQLQGGKTTPVTFTTLSEPTKTNLQSSSGPRFIFSD